MSGQTALPRSRVKAHIAHFTSMKPYWLAVLECLHIHKHDLPSLLCNIQAGSGSATCSCLRDIRGYQLSAICAAVAHTAPVAGPALRHISGSGCRMLRRLCCCCFPSKQSRAFKGPAAGLLRVSLVDEDALGDAPAVPAALQQPVAANPQGMGPTQVTSSNRRAMPDPWKAQALQHNPLRRKGCNFSAAARLETEQQSLFRDSHCSS